VLEAVDDSTAQDVAFFVNGARVQVKAVAAQARPLSADSRSMIARFRWPAMSRAEVLWKIEGATQTPRPDAASRALWRWVSGSTKTPKSISNAPAEMPDNWLPRCALKVLWMRAT